MENNCNICGSVFESNEKENVCKECNNIFNNFAIQVEDEYNEYKERFIK